MIWLLLAFSIVVLITLAGGCRRGPRHARSGFFWCCEPPACVIHDDSFTRANSTDLGADWTEVAGDWSIASNQLSISAADAIVTSDPAAANDFTYVAVVVKIGADGSAGRVIFDYTDSSNYSFAELKAGPATGGTPGHFKVVQKVAGVDSELHALTRDFVLSTNYTVEVCYSSSSLLFVNVIGQSLGIVASCHFEGHTLTSSVVGLGTGSWTSPAPAILFDGFAHRHVDPARTGEGCDDCLGYECGGCSGDPPTNTNEYQVDIAGITNNTCLDCASLNATYIVKQVACSYFKFFTAICTADRIKLQFQTFSGERIDVEFRAGGTTLVNISKTQAGEFDCKTLSGEVLSTIGGGASSQCTWSSATATVTAL